jgi:hypothetical protein
MRDTPQYLYYTAILVVYSGDVWLDGIRFKICGRKICFLLFRFDVSHDHHMDGQLACSAPQWAACMHASGTYSTSTSTSTSELDFPV